MAADAWKVYNYAKEAMAEGSIDMEDTATGGFKCALISSSYTPTATHNDFSAQIQTYEVTGNGAAVGGETLTNVVWTDTSGTVKWDADDIEWTASGGTIQARYAVIYHVSTDVPIACCLMDNTPQDVSVTDTNTLTIQLNASGIFNLSGGW